MPLLVADHITKYYGADLILEDVSLTIHERDRVGLIGANGTGKTTLCKLMLRELEPDDGGITIARAATMGYLPQDADFPPGQTLWEAAMSVFPEMREMERRLRGYEEQMSHPDAEGLDALIERHDRVRGEYERAGGYEYETRAATILTGVGFAEPDFGRPVESFSGGEKSRAALATLLLQDPDILLLDEPTNHLDIQGIEWLEEYLRDYYGAAVIISHDRRFLNRAVRRIVELSSHQLEEYTGGYDDYVRQKEDRLLNYGRMYQKQQRERERQLAFIRWALGTKQEKRVRAAKSRLKLLEKVDWLDPPAGQQRKVNLRFTPRTRGGNEIVELSKVAIGYGGRPLVHDIHLFMRRGERVGIVGPNGCGKTTLLSVILGRMAPLEGTARLGTSVEVGHFAQERAELNPEHTVIEEFGEVVPDATPAELRHLLARFLFVEEDVFKTVGQLSGGEESRLALAKLIMTRPTFLVLDEPTNHLDIDSRGALEGALQEYTGTLLIVSHDRYFLDGVVNQILAIDGSSARLHRGNYSSYREALQQEREEREHAAAAAEEARKRARLREERIARREKLEGATQSTASGLNPWQRQRRIEELERQAEDLEARIARIEALLADERTYADTARVQALSAEYERLKQELERAYEEWDEVVARE